MWVVTRENGCTKGCKEIQDKLNDGRLTSRVDTHLGGIFLWSNQPEGRDWWADKHSQSNEFQIKWQDD